MATQKLPQKGTPEWHQLQIARKTMHMTPVMANMMGGMSVSEAQKVMDKYGLRYAKGGNVNWKTDKHWENMPDKVAEDAAEYYGNQKFRWNAKKTELTKAEIADMVFVQKMINKYHPEHNHFFGKQLAKGGNLPQATIHSIEQKLNNKTFAKGGSVEMDILFGETDTETEVLEPETKTNFDYGVLFTLKDPSKQQAFEQLVDELAGDCKQEVDRIEHKLATTKNHYGDYAGLLTTLAHNKINAYIMGTALIRAGANVNGIVDALRVSYGNFAKGGSIGTELMGASQNGEPKPSGYTLVRFENGKRTAIVKDEDGNLEAYAKSPHFAGYHLIIDGVDYEYTNSFAQGGTFGTEKFSFNYLNLEILTTGDLKVTLTDEGKEKIADEGLTWENANDYFDDVNGNSEFMYFEDSSNVQTGKDSYGFGLTEAPVFLYGWYPTFEGYWKKEKYHKEWLFMDYAINDLWELLARDGEITITNIKNYAQGGSTAGMTPKQRKQYNEDMKNASSWEDEEYPLPFKKGGTTEDAGLKIALARREWEDANKKFYDTTGSDAIRRSVTDVTKPKHAFEDSVSEQFIDWLNAEYDKKAIDDRNYSKLFNLGNSNTSAKLFMDQWVNLNRSYAKKLIPEVWVNYFEMIYFQCKLRKLRSYYDAENNFAKGGNLYEIEENGVSLGYITAKNKKDLEQRIFEMYGKNKGIQARATDTFNERKFAKGGKFDDGGAITPETAASHIIDFEAGLLILNDPEVQAEFNAETIQAMRASLEDGINRARAAQGFDVEVVKPAKKGKEKVAEPAAAETTASKQDYLDSIDGLLEILSMSDGQEKQDIQDTIDGLQVMVDMM